MGADGAEIEDENDGAAVWRARLAAVGWGYDEEEDEDEEVMEEEEGEGAEGEEESLGKPGIATTCVQHQGL
jgi:hypothetical protein